MKTGKYIFLALWICSMVLAPLASAQFNTGSGPYDSVTATIRQPDGKILIGGGFTSVDGIPRNGIARLNADGSLDLSFNPGVDANLGSSVRSFALLPDGRIYAAGGFIFVRQTTVTNDFPRNIFRGIIRLNPDGSVDDTFDPRSGTSFGGSVVFTSPPRIQKIALQPDGRLLVVGSFDNYDGNTARGICRLFPDGSFDFSFGGNVGFGSRTFLFPPESTVPVVESVTLVDGGKILVTGEFAGWNLNFRRCIARLNADGTHDSTFNPELGATNLDPTEETGGTGGATIKTVAVQPDGRIIAVGSFLNFNGVPRRSIVRLSANGAIDLSYNTGALISIGTTGDISDISLQPDGTAFIVGTFTAVNNVQRRGVAKIGLDGKLDTGFSPGLGFIAGTASIIFRQPDDLLVIAGDFTNFNGTSITAILRMRQNGSLDGTSEGDDDPNNIQISGGIDFSFKTSPGPNAQVNAVVVQPDGKIVMTGQFTTYNGTSALRIARVNTDGSLDVRTNSNAGFSPGTGPNGFGFSLKQQPDGKILVGGSFTAFNGITAFGIARLNTDGTVDTTFDTSNGPNGTVLGIALQDDGKVVIAGSFTQFGGGVSRAGIARLNANGSLDTSFNPGTGANGAMKAVALQSDGKIIAGGTFTSFAGRTAGRLVRLNRDGSFDSSFKVGSGAENTVEALLVLPDNKIMVAGNFGQINLESRNRVARLNADGSVDLSFSNPAEGPTGVVKCLALESATGKIFIGGEYDRFNGLERAYNPARLRTDGALDTTFTPPSAVNQAILIGGLALQSNNKVVAVGRFFTQLVLPAPTVSDPNATITLTFNNAIRLQNYILDGRLVNVSSRAKVETGGDVVIGGFVVQGITHKRVMVRAMGPSLSNFGVAGALSAPTLEVYDSRGQLMLSNTGWQTNPFKSDIVHSGLAPGHDRDSAVMATLAPGAYTAKVSGAGDTVGVALVEVYDLDARAAPRMINLSTRAKVQQGDNVLIGGFAIRDDSRRVIVRAIGPTLTNYGVLGALQRPSLTVTDSTGRVVASNNGWRSAANANSLQAAGLAPSDDRESALLLDLPVGTYTAIVRGADGSSGNALVEVYETP